MVLIVKQQLFNLKALTSCSWFAGSNPAESDGFLKATKICSLTSFRGKVKPSASCHKFLRHVQDPLRYDRNTDRQNSVAISCPVSPVLLLGVPAVTRAQNSGG
jgi:hypothetical protein